VEGRLLPALGILPHQTAVDQAVTLHLLEVLPSKKSPDNRNRLRSTEANHSDGALADRRGDGGNGLLPFVHPNLTPASERSRPGGTAPRPRCASRRGRRRPARGGRCAAPARTSARGRPSAAPGAP